MEDSKPNPLLQFECGENHHLQRENYLKAIAEAQSEGETVIAATLARWLNVSPPGGHHGDQAPEARPLIDVDKEGRISLTPEGREIANRVLNRHHLIERMLAEIFGMEWYKVHDEAEQLEHAVSAEFERRLQEKLGAEVRSPARMATVSAFDTPEDKRQRGWKPLDEFEPSRGHGGERFRTRPQTTRVPAWARHLSRRGSAVLARNYDDTITLQIAGTIHSAGQIGRR